MASRSLFVRAFLACTLLPLIQARAAEDVSRSPVAGYRAYAAEQAEMLVRMTRLLAKDVRDGQIEAGRNDFAMTHRYLERIRPLLRLRPELERRLDARDAGFGLVERDLFSAHAIDAIAAADRLSGDARELQRDVATLPVGYDLLVEGPAAEIDGVSARVLSGEAAPYAKTDLWDLEAGLDGAQAMVAEIRPQVAARDPLLVARISAAFAEAGKRLAEVSEGCGYRSFDTLTNVDKARLREATTALSRELAKLKLATAID